MSGFPGESGKTRLFVTPRRLTGGLPDVRTGRVRRSGLIRCRRTFPGLVQAWELLQDLAKHCLQGAVIAYQSE
jgi:hypothetical protein